MVSKQCCILVGGLGTRLGELTRELPKPLLPVDGIPFLEVLVGEAVRRGFEDILLLAGFKSMIVRNFATDLQSRLPAAVRLRVSIEPEPLGTGGALLHARDQLSDSFLLLNGDTWFDFNWLDLFMLAGSRSSIAVRRIENADRYETLDLSADGTVRQIVPRSADRGTALVNGGVYVLQKSDLEQAPGRFSIEADLLPMLIGRGALKGRAYDGFFLDIGIPETFELAQTAILARRRRPAVFFDRDGVLNHDDDYVASVDRFRWIDGAMEAVRLANDLGYYVFVVTNQAGVARGLYDERAVTSLHCWISAQLREHGAHIDDWRYCPYHPEGTVESYRAVHGWRKPEPGMLVDLLESWPVDVERSILVGDKESDCAAARAIGIRPLLFRGGNLRDFLVESLASRFADTSDRQADDSISS